MRIYLDHQATTPLDPLVAAAMRPWWEGVAGNSASLQHASGRAARDAVEHARAQIAAGLHCEPREIVFTSGATESNNLAIKGVALGLAPDRAQRFVSTAAEHRAVLDPLRRLARRGANVVIAPATSEGAVDLERLAAAVHRDTALVSVIFANNEVGALNDLGEVCDLVRTQAPDALIHSDASQAPATLPLDLSRLPVDLLSLSAHKVYGPQGVGVLFVRRREQRIPLEPLIEGGGHEHGLRSGTLPTALIVGFGAAMELAGRRRGEDAAAAAAHARRLWSLLESLPGVLRNGPTVDQRLPGNLNISIEDVDGDALLTELDRAGLDVSSGAACSSNNPAPSHVLRAMGRSDRLARASVRFGAGRGTTDAEIDAAARAVIDVVQRLRESRPPLRRPPETAGSTR